MTQKYEFSAEQIEELRKARRKNKDKNVARRLKALLMYAEGKTGREIAAKTGYCRPHLYKIFEKYFSNGLQAVTENQYRGNHRNMSFEEEAAFLEQFLDDAGRQTASAAEIKAAYEEKIGHKTGHGQIYYVLHRHGWKKKTREKA